MQATRRKILDILKELGSASIEELARCLGLAPITVRHHMSRLQQSGLVRSGKVHGRVGRPHYEYSLTSRAEEVFPKQYAQLSSVVLDEARERLGEDALSQMMGSLGIKWASRVTAGGGGSDLRSRLDLAVAELVRHGYMAEWKKTEEGYFILLRNCPYLEVAREHQALCAMDTEFIGHVLASPAELEGRVIEGQANCTYHLKVADREQA